jgi:hypothetical protein
MQTPVIRDIRLLGFIVGERNSNGDFYTVIAWCFECRAWHAHTGFNSEPELGVQLHRHPRCNNENFTNRLYDGYVIEIVGRATPEVLADHLRTKPRGLKPEGWHEGESPVA